MRRDTHQPVLTSAKAVAAGRPSWGQIVIGLALPLGATIPGLLLRFSGWEAPAVVSAVTFAGAVVGAAFLLTWGTELAEIDIGEGLALALLALIAVLPEYAVDAVFAWKAGKDPAQYAPLAMANMTGANRLLIGVGWSVVALVAIAALRRERKAQPEPVAQPSNLEPAEPQDAVQLREVQVVELAFLALATVYGLTLSLRTTLTLLDTLVLFSIFAAYLWRIRSVEAKGSGSDAEAEGDEESELFGPARQIAALSPGTRRLIMAGMLLVAAAVILAVAEPFAESLVAAGRQLRVSEFLLVQWVAPLASETPEFIAVLLLAWRLQGAAALGALISSKINQWTLLVGVLPLVFNVSTGSLGGLPIDVVQREELLLTAAQSLYALALVIKGRLSSRGAWALLALFLAQFIAAWVLPPGMRGIERLGIAAIYLVLAVVLLVRRRADLVSVIKTGFGVRARSAN